MKNKFQLIFFLIFFHSSLHAENVLIESKKISLDKGQQISIFEKEVFLKTDDGYEINSEYAEYNKKTGLIKLKNNIIGKDKKNNIIKTDHAEYNEITKIFTTKGPTKVITSENYIIDGQDILLNNTQNFIKSNKFSTIIDQDDNIISLDNFEYQIKDNLFKSVGKINFKDKMKNNYEFSQIYIDTLKKEILGTDTKAYFNDKNFKISDDNKPRIFSNSMSLDKQKSVFNKSVFTICDYRKNNKCPPWSIQSSKMLHDSEKKTIYYDNAIIRVYNIPIFFIPKISHPDPTVNRRSGFLPPAFSNSNNLSSGVSIPYFWAINNDKNFTLTNKLYASENPLFLGGYHQAFKNSNLITDFGYTKGYKKENSKKKKGDKSHLFTKFVKNFEGQNGFNNTLSITNEHVSNDKYLKLYKVESNLVDYNTDTLNNTFEFTSEKDDLFFGLNANVFETLNENYSDKYEYIYPEITFDRNLISNNKIGNLDLQTNYKVHKYDTNKFSNFLVNDFNWNYNEFNFDTGLNGKLLGNLKNINYETKNIDIYKKNTTSELFGALGYLTELSLKKQNDDKSPLYLLKPKFLARFAPGNMRQETDSDRLNPANAFSLNRLNNINNYETGLSGTLGLDYEIKKNNKENFSLSIAQVVNEKENKKIGSKSSMDEKLSDLVGETNYLINDNVSLNYNFAIDQNYKDLNYTEFGAKMDLNPISIKFDFIEEGKHIGEQKYFKTKVDFAKTNNGLLSFSTKRNLVTDSSEFYNLSYEYFNDCLRAGIAYRREFYNDSELEPENSLMFQITLTPFGNINSPSFNK